MSGELTVEAQIEAFIEYLAAQKHYSANTLVAYRNDLTQFLQFVTEQRPYISSWAHVNSLVLQGFVLDLRNRKYSPSSIARKVAAIKSFYYYLVEARVLASNPTLEIEPPRVTKQPPHVLTEEQVTMLLAAPTDPTPKGLRDRALLQVMYATGIRVTELVTLDVRDVDLEAGVVKVGKGARERSLTLSESARTALREYLEKGRHTYGVPAEEGPLFVNPRGGGLTRQGVWLILKQYVRAAGIDTQVAPHALRHSFAAHRLAHGTSIQDVQRMLGHAHLSTTQVYNRGQSIPQLAPPSPAAEPERQ